MSKVEMFRVVVNERLSAAAEEILGLFERSIAEYEEELFRSKRENEQQRKLLDAVLKPEVRLHRADVRKEPPHTKEVQVKLWRMQEGEPPQGSLPVKRVNYEEKAQSLHLHQGQEKAEPAACSRAQCMEKGIGEKDRGGPEQADTKLKEAQTGASVSQPAREGDTSNSSEPETENSDEDDDDDDGKETKKTKKTLTGVPAAAKGCNDGKNSLRCFRCGKIFDLKDCVQSNGKSPQGKRPFVCSVCVQISTQSKHLVSQKTQYGKKTFGCLVCKKQFSFKGDAVRHVRIHTGERPYTCTVCGKKFSQSTGLASHMRTHTGEKPHSCPLCPRRFIRTGLLVRHMRVHTGEKPYNCSACNTRFSLSQSLLKHMRIHTGEKPYSCEVCDKKFLQKGHLTQHMTLHTGEKSFTCRVCNRKFSRQSSLKNHRCKSSSSSSK
ncbi:gastrula zinc finger protein XlCGF57.1-like [Centropristis striata]|uniref:gastrula zinc finger protein XlCGF57.1-like n=1 Tax=Centropristis striata TaxID=184440 RepID=UPI0027E13A67|nr:gastrula zinc finger protein XlCGF57.1-like [Centropristis striata]